MRPSEWMQEIGERHKGGKFRYWNQVNAPECGTEVWRVEIEKATNSPMTQYECPSRSKLWGQHYMALLAQLHASAALAPYCLKNFDADAAGQKLDIQRGYCLGKGQVQQEGRMRSSRRVCRSKTRVAISKRIVVRSSKSVQVQKKCNGVQKKVFSLVFEVRIPALQTHRRPGGAPRLLRCPQVPTPRAPWNSWWNMPDFTRENGDFTGGNLGFAIFHHEKWWRNQRVIFSVNVRISTIQMKPQGLL